MRKLLSLILLTAFACSAAPRWTPEATFVKLFGLLFPQVLRMGYKVSGGGAGISYVNSVAASSTSVSSLTTSALNTLSGDQLIIGYGWGVVGSCAATLTISDASGDASTQIGSNLTNEWSASSCAAFFTIKSTSANASQTVSASASSGNPNSELLVIQVRGSANATADQNGCNNTSGPSGSSARVPAASGASSPCSNGTITTTNAAAMIVQFVATQNAITSVTPTANACFGVTGTMPITTGIGGMQYTILSSTQSGSCQTSWTGSSTYLGAIGSFH